jgi:RES domain-containing protein
VDRSNPSNDYRYNRRRTFPSLYLTDDRETTLWETRQRVRTAAGVLRFPIAGGSVAVYDAILERLLDVTNPIVMAGLRTNLQELTGNWLELTDSDDGAPTQWLGEAAHRSGRFAGLLVPSVYRSRRNIVVMRDRLGPAERVSFIGFVKL